MLSMLILFLCLILKVESLISVSILPFIYSSFNSEDVLLVSVTWTFIRYMTFAFDRLLFRPYSLLAAHEQQFNSFMSFSSSSGLLAIVIIS